MTVDVVNEEPAFTLHGCGGWDTEPENDELVPVSWQELREAPVGHTWQALYRGNIRRAIRNESATVVFRSERGCALLFRRWGVTDSDNATDWEGAPELVWYEFLD